MKLGMDDEYMSTLADLENDLIGHQLLNSMDKFENPVPELAYTCH
jgi:hypothetical protein